MWVMLSREPTLDWALNSTFSFFISTFPPPDKRSSKVNKLQWHKTRATKRRRQERRQEEQYFSCSHLHLILFNRRNTIWKHDERSRNLVYDECWPLIHILTSRWSDRSSCAQSEPVDTHTGALTEREPHSQWGFHAATDELIPQSVSLL